LVILPAYGILLNHLQHKMENTKEA